MDVFLVLLILVMITVLLLDHREIPVSVPKAANAGREGAQGLGPGHGLRPQHLPGRNRDRFGLRGDPACGRRSPPTPPTRCSSRRITGSLYEDVIRLLDWVRGAGVRKYALKVARSG